MRAFLLAMALLAGPVAAQTTTGIPKGAWVPDQGDGTYRNPVLMGDYSDPDVTRVGDDYYLVASSFTNVPGLPVLHSKDLVNWDIIGHALAAVPPYDHFRTPRRGGGVWAPAIRYHDGRFMIYYPDPDFGIFLVTATDPAGPWSAPVLVDKTVGAIDPCPFWDDDGRGYLVHAFAGSRAHKNNLVVLKPLNADGTQTLGEGQVIIDGNTLGPVATSLGMAKWFTIEGPKLYKRNGYYYIFAPAGGVKNGWQGVFRSRSLSGPYEARNVLDQGNGPANGPHQGAWVDTPFGEDWFVHFEDTDSYGRRVWLEPMRWGRAGTDRDWPQIGERQAGHDIGQSVEVHKKPKTAGPVEITVPVADDSFDGALNAAWQWNSNPGDDWLDLSARPGFLRLKSISSSGNLWEAGNELTQKLPNLSFSAVTQMALSPKWEGERAGLVFFGASYGFIGVENTRDGTFVVQVTRSDADTFQPEVKVTGPKVAGDVWLKLTAQPVSVPAPAPNYRPIWPAMLQTTDARVTFSYSLDGVTWTPLGDGFTSKPGRWVGAQIGLFAQAPSGTPSSTSTRVGWADFDSFSVGLH